MKNRKIDKNIFLDIYLSKESLRALVHKNDFEGAVFSESSWALSPLYVESPVDLLLYCFWFLSFWTFCFLTSVILSRDRRVRLSSDLTKDFVPTGLVFCESSRKPEYPAFWVMLESAIFASNKFDSMFIGVPESMSKESNVVK